ncbi:unnamed protein product [Vitrella brassicaformis CCMP3155]|uniref:Transmembrane protein n=2 Tax=Vitrella brassicaformis TaxID=1169539 RepID=A0A0G4H1H4_VITBC|nr:unnamed protein product [Vitrella brassicaformis CCMP3155]|mmetsp:Transcript_44034/g.109792  ORF Transcript_44034/g.109792 Transcript_44034/m.109792 type:complete len:374 (+) Transcript_44034:59-1180(+)|eukprot:CEM37316.1 unnamed protein product [Vitrella brassicaformis CCMP3155]
MPKFRSQPCTFVCCSSIMSSPSLLVARLAVLVYVAAVAHLAAAFTFHSTVPSVRLSRHHIRPSSASARLAPTLGASVAVPPPQTHADTRQPPVAPVTSSAERFYPSSYAEVYQRREAVAALEAASASSKGNVTALAADVGAGGAGACWYPVLVRQFCSAVSGQLMRTFHAAKGQWTRLHHMPITDAAFLQICLKHLLIIGLTVFVYRWLNMHLTSIPLPPTTATSPAAGPAGLATIAPHTPSARKLLSMIAFLRRRQSSDVADDVVEEVVSAGDKATGLWLTTGAVGVLVLGLWQQAASARRRERARIRRALDEYEDAKESWIREGIDPEAEEYLRQQGYRRPQYQAYTQGRRQQTDTDKRPGKGDEEEDDEW